MKLFDVEFGERWHDNIFNSERSLWLQCGGCAGRRPEYSGKPIRGQFRVDDGRF